MLVIESISQVFVEEVLLDFKAEDLFFQPFRGVKLVFHDFFVNSLLQTTPFDFRTFHQSLVEHWLLLGIRFLKDIHALVIVVESNIEQQTLELRQLEIVVEHVLLFLFFALCDALKSCLSLVVLSQHHGTAIEVRIEVLVVVAFASGIFFLLFFDCHVGIARCLLGLDNGLETKNTTFHGSRVSIHHDLNGMTKGHLAPMLARSLLPLLEALVLGLNDLTFFLDMLRSAGLLHPIAG